LQLTHFELGHPDAAPALGGAEERGEHELEHSALREGVRDHLGSSPLLAEQPLEKIRRRNRPRVCERDRRRATQVSKSSSKHATADGRSPP
jgi:hypothetical protein